MRKQTDSSIKAQLLRSGLVLLSFLAVCVIPFALAQRNGVKQSNVQYSDVSSDTKVAETALAPSNIITVTNTLDGPLPTPPPGSLRWALAIANDGDTINFAVTGTITLTSGGLDVNHSVTISGPGAPNLAVNGNGAGAVFYINYFDPAGVVISGLTITNGGGGGGILNDNATLTVTNCTIRGNANAGRGIYNNAGTLTLSDCTVSGNSADYGGGIANSGGLIPQDYSVTLTNCTVSGNSATQAGGGIWNSPPLTGGSATVTLKNCTLSGNSAPNGGSIYNAIGPATVEMGDTILNAGASGGTILNAGTFTSLGYNLASDNGGGVLTGLGDQINTAPMLGPLQNNGGPTLTHALLPGSPAIDSGNPNFTPPPLYDQRGPVFARVANGRIDKGSFEVQASNVSGQMMRGESANVFVNGNSNNIDEPLRPTDDFGVIASQPPVSHGVVADGVTPLLFKFQQATAAQASYTVAINNPALAARLQISEGGVWTQGNTITFDGVNPTQFAYIEGLVPDATLFPNGATEINAVLTLTNGNDVVATNFRVRRAPIILVHGYNTDSSTWDPPWGMHEFLYALSAATVYLPNDYPDSFIRLINYGVLNNFNTWGSFPALARELDTQLRSEESVLHQNWAFTRYDVVGHSQGGVLTRMLCAQNASPITSNNQFKGPENFYRGRFRRVITIGSPHNGSTLPYYVSQLHDLYGVLPRFLGELLQPKFNPFGDQIHWINDSSVRVDQDAKFRLITATITGGNVPLSSPLCYSLIGLNKLSIHHIGLTRGEVVLSNGSDGVVDIQSQRAGAGTPVSEMTFNICHALPPAGAGSGVAGLVFFGTSSAETTEPIVGSRVADLLTLPVSNFGAFQLPVNLSPNRKAEIDAEIPLFAVLDLIRPLGAARIATTGSVSYPFMFTPDPSEPLDGTANWYAEVFGPNGVTAAGLTVTPDPLDSTHVTVDVDNSVLGDVALYLSYNSTTGHLIVGRPVLVVSIPPGANLTGIELHPNQITAMVGDVIGLEVWGLYDNGMTSQLFVQPENSTFTSSNPNVAVVDNGTGLLRAAGLGNATITATYAGLTNEATIHVSRPRLGPRPRPSPHPRPTPSP
jgi:pimeloyl-ACP methyl ester carboxylesterase